jgi:hypothetical protein
MQMNDLLAGTAATTSEELVWDLRRQLEAWLEETDAKLPVADPEWQPNKDWWGATVED